MVRIITDSASDLEVKDLERLNVDCVSLSVFFGEDEYFENVNITKSEFYEMLASSKETPHTSQPSPEKFMEVLKKAKDAGDDAVVVSLSSALSGTCQSVRLAKDMLEYENCYIVDCLSVSIGQMLLVEVAAKLRDENKTAKEIVDELESLKSRISLYACVDTLEYLHKGGRLSGVSYAIGTLTNIKPVIHIKKDGTAEVAAKVLGKNKGIKHLAGIFEKHPCDENYPIYILYSHDRTNAENLTEAIEKQGYKVEKISHLGAVIGTHAGPDAFGFAYIEK